MKARLHPIWVGGRDGYRYSVLYDGKLLVDRSRDPECDAARALVAKGITGKLAMCDGKTGVPRTIIDIEKAAKLMISEESRDGLRFRSYRGNPDNSSHSLETGAVGPSVPPSKEEAA
jgi:hypothetical protein